jgi:hypothetical protein
LTDLPVRPRNIWLRSFYGFGPEDDGYIGWTELGPRDRMLGKVEDGDLFMIYGATSAETSVAQRNRILGFLQIEVRAIRDADKASVAGMKRKKDHGWQDKWTHAIPVVRAWRVNESILLERVASKTYRPEAGQAIAVWNPPLLPEEVDLALKVRVTEVNVFGEPPILEAPLAKIALSQAYQPSRAFPGSFGERTVLYEDGPTHLYLTRFDGDGFALIGERKPVGDMSALIKIGVSNDHARRLAQLNSGFPPAAVGKWGKPMLSELYPSRKAAEDAEAIFKDTANAKLRSLGGEFFFGNWDRAQIIFAGIPGVARFGK